MQISIIGIALVMAFGCVPILAQTKGKGKALLGFSILDLTVMGQFPVGSSSVPNRQQARRDLSISAYVGLTWAGDNSRLLVDFAFFHHEFNILKQLDVF